MRFLDSDDGFSALHNGTKSPAPDTLKNLYLLRDLSHIASETRQFLDFEEVILHRKLPHTKVRMSKTSACLASL
jgi:hypothetical protein